MDLEERTAELFRRAEAQDYDGFLAMFAPGGIIKHNYDDGGPAADALVTLRGLAAAGITITYENVRRIVGVDAVVEQHDVRGTRLSDGAQVVTDVCVVVRFDADGLITQLDEYLDPRAFRSLFAPL
jgi:ketosteroid isomerase-like protein